MQQFQNGVPNSVKTYMIMFFTLFSLLVLGNFYSFSVCAKEGDLEIYARGEGYITSSSNVKGITYDADNNVITLNNYVGNGLSIYSADNKLKNVELKIVGKNTLSVDSENYYNNLLLFYDVDVKISGNGTLDLDLSSEGAYTFFEQKGYGSITIDGPTINMDNSAGSLYTDGDFIFKSGTLNIYRYPRIRITETYTEFVYHEAISVCKNMIVSGGKINIEYVYPEDYTNVQYSYSGYRGPVAIGSTCEPIIAEGCISLTLPEELKDKIILLNEQKITVYAVNEDGVSVNISDGESLDGITWDNKNNVLTLNGYNGREISVESTYLKEIEIKIIGENTISSSSWDLIYLGTLSARFTGTGTLNLNASNTCDDAIYANKDLSRIVFDGPTINITVNGNGFEYPAIYVGKIEMISGTIHAVLRPCLFQGSYLYKGLMIGYGEGVTISGGTIIIEHDASGIENEVSYDDAIFKCSSDSYYGMAGKIDTDNCVIIVTGLGNIVNEYIVFKDIDRSDDRSGINIGDGTIIIFADSLDEAVPIDITKIKASLSQTEYTYDGTEKKPVVKVGGLVEGNDFTVTYANNKEVGTATVTITGKGYYKGTIKLTFEIKKKSSNGKADGPKAGSTIKDKKYIYKVTKAGSKDGNIIGELEVTGLKKTSLTQIKIAANVKIGGVTYKVTSVGAKAFKGNKKITKATIGKKVKKIGTSAFANCKKLKQVTINSKALKTIGKSAFCGNKKLTKVIIKSTKLKKIGKKAFFRKGGKKLTVKVPKAKKKAYKKLLKKAKTNKFAVK